MGTTGTKKATEPTTQELLARIAELEAMQKNGGKISFKVSDKGAVSVYGMGRFPVTLYKGQWDKLIANLDALKAFIKANESQLSMKE